MPPTRRTRRGWNVREQGGIIPREVGQRELESLTEQEIKLGECQRKLKGSEHSSVEQQNEVIGKAIEVLYGYLPRPGQMDTLRWLLFEKKDMILVAKTSFGKSMISQALPCLVPNSTAIVILPLLALGSEQLEKIRQLPFAKPVFVNAENSMDFALKRDITCGKYTHVLVSPELLVGSKFRGILQNASFRNRLKWVIIDEVHLVSVWGKNFRKSYATLRSVRYWVGDKVWFGCTATLDTNAHRDICDFAGFKEDTRLVRTSIDRPDIAFVREIVKKSEKLSFKPLQFIVSGASELPSELQELWNRGATASNCSASGSRRDTSRQPTLFTWEPVCTPGTYGVQALLDQTSATVPRRKRTGNARGQSRTLPLAHEWKPCPDRIPKTVIFLDTRIMCRKAMKKIRKWLCRLGYSKAMAAATVQSFYSTMTTDDKDTLLDAFAKPGSSIRILVSSDALAHGKDIPDIEVVAVYGIPRDKDPSIFLQKFGRGARGSGYTGKAILFGDCWCLGDRGSNSAGPPKKGRNQQSLVPATRDIPGREEATDAEMSSVITATDVPSPRSIRLGTPQPNYEVDSDIDSGMAHQAMDKVTKPKKRVKTNCEKRADLPPVIWEFMNSTSCLRRIFLRHFSEELPTDYQTERCCSNCNPTLGVRKEFDLDLEDRGARQEQESRHNELEDSIKKWLTKWLDENLNDYDFALVSDHIMSEREIIDLCSVSGSNTDRNSLKEHLLSYHGVGILREKDIEELVEFIIHERGRLAEKRTSDAPAGRSLQGNGRQKRKRSGNNNNNNNSENQSVGQRALVQIDPNVRSSAKRRKRK